MKYMGSKNRLAKELAPIIQSYITEDTKGYLEPFVGGANMIDKIVCDKKYGSDINEYLIELLIHVRDGGKLYDSVSKELYNIARDCFYNKDIKNFEKWEIGNIGFIASFNGRWFDGGYAKTGIEKTKYGEKIRDYYNESKNNIEKQAPLLKDIVFKNCSFLDIKPNISDYVIYCDPPYKGTKQYINSIDFDYECFYNWCISMSKNNIVLVSEEYMPNDFECIWQKKTLRSIKAKDKSFSNEKLFICK